MENRNGERVLKTVGTILLVLSSHAAVASITNQSTHTVSSPNEVYIGESATVSWTPKAAYSGYNYTSYFFKVYPPAGSGLTSYVPTPSPTGQHTSVRLTEPGQWCFKLRARTSTELSGFSNTSCTNVVNYPSIQHEKTHYISPITPTDINKKIRVEWKARSAFAGWPFGSYRIQAIKPNGDKLNEYTTNTWFEFPVEETMSGKWQFRVRAHLNGLGSYSDFEDTYVQFGVIQRQANNLLGDGSFQDTLPSDWRAEGTVHNAIRNPNTGKWEPGSIVDANSPDKDFIPKREFFPFSRHANHIGGNYRTANNTIKFTSYKTGEAAEYSEFPLDITHPLSKETTRINSLAEFKSYCSQESNNFDIFQCRKSEISFAPVNFDGYATRQDKIGKGGSTTYLAYRFKINEWYTEEECTEYGGDKSNYRHCKIFVSQYHYENNPSTKRDEDFAPLVAVDVRRYGEGAYDDIIMHVTQKTDVNFDSSICDTVGKTHVFSCDISSRTIDETKDGDFLDVGQYYNVVLKVTWSETTGNGHVSAWFSRDGGASYRVIADRPVKTLLDDSDSLGSPRLLFGMYMGGADGTLVNNRENNGQPPISLEFEQIYKTEKLSHLPAQFQNVHITH